MKILAWRGEKTRRAEGTQHAQAPGEVSGANSPDPSPSPGDPYPWAELADSALMQAAANMIELQAGRRSGLAAELRDRAAQFAAFESITAK